LDSSDNILQPHLSSQFLLAQARPEDFHTIATLFEALHAYNTSLDPSFALNDDWQALLDDYFSRTCTTSNVLWLLAWQETHPAGLLVVKAHTDSPLFQHRSWTELMAIYVVPACRGTPLAKQLVNYARDWTAARGCDRLQLYVTSANERARAFYRSCGLRPVQEIWRLDIDTPSGAGLPGQDSSDTDDTDFLEPGHHHYLGGENQDTWQ
jgi:GNAT superfamily N-acetyltransferase